MITDEEVKRLSEIEKIIHKIAEEFGLITTKINFEIVPVQRMLEGSAYGLPTNFSHWTFGRDYEKQRTIYEHSASGVAYEQVWNMDPPRAFIVDTNPFALKVLTMAHVYGHIDYFRANHFCKRSHELVDLEKEGRNAANRFRDYEVKYGKEEVERTIDAGMSLWDYQNPDPFIEEEIDETIVRQRLIQIEREKIKAKREKNSEFIKKDSVEEKEETEHHLKYLSRKRPPQRINSLLPYIAKYSPNLKEYQRDILQTMFRQRRAILIGARSGMGNEGWAAYWHVRIMHKLFETGVLNEKDHGVYNESHSDVLSERKTTLNVYRVGLALWQNIEERWNKGRFGREFDECEDYIEKAYWDTGANQGTEKIFEIRANYSDRMLVEEFFTNQFIRENKIYIYQEDKNPAEEKIDYIVVSKDPDFVRGILKNSYGTLGIQPIFINDANYHRRGELYLEHLYYRTRTELDAEYRDRTLENIYFLWGKRVFIQSIINNKTIICSFNGKKHRIEENQ